MTNAASRAQLAAANPENSTWLAANAGSGKTKVLIDRVARLLLRRVPPARILCLTYTKAAATEMQIRLFDRLGKWAMLPDIELRQQLAALDIEDSASPETIPEARRLFARALETPGGLKIQTIHSFCAALLRRFPLEAGVSPQFSEMDDRSARLLRDEVLAEMADGPHLPLIDALARIVTDDDLDDIAKAVVAAQDCFATPMTLDQALEAVGLWPGFGESDVATLPFIGTEKALFRQVLPFLTNSTKTMVELAGVLHSIDPEAPTPAMLTALFDAFLYSKGGQRVPEAKTPSIPTQTVARAMGPLLDDFHAFMHRVAAAKNGQWALAAAEKTLALHHFAATFLPDYAARKLSRGWLDFDDLILRARDLLTDSSRAQWVLFRLDGGIDHILVDEAQDTGPAQWQVIQRLTEEFHAGQGAHDRPRTVFVVGDKKQSIYSFQGADLGTFDKMHDHFAVKLRDVSVTLADLQLAHSFRSSPAILHLVDQTLQGAEGLGDPMRHLPFYPDQPGRIDLWPVAEAEDKPDDTPWYDPVDRRSPHNATTVLADRLAVAIAAMLSRGTRIRSRGTERLLRPGDIIILVQRRRDMFREMIRACKAKGLPVAGADRLKLASEIAVRDMTALMSFLALPEDELALAEALRSPLLGLTEGNLYDLAQPRGKAGLWQALRGQTGRFPTAIAMLHDLRDQAGFLRPYELVERILTRHKGREKLLARLGPEAEDGIDAFAQQALAYERLDVPSLSGFLTWLAADAIEVKRQADASGQLIRVMTVHGAKGLEAPVIILPDTNSVQKQTHGMILKDRDTGRALWNTGAQSPFEIQSIRDAAQTAQSEEQMRLLYVALTRAENWLIVAAPPKPSNQPNAPTWYDKIAEGFAETALVPGMIASTEIEVEGAGRFTRLSWGSWPADHGAETITASVTARMPLPGWARDPAPTPVDRLAALTPSGLGGAKALPGEPSATQDASAGLLQGSRLHLLLEHLPATPARDWPHLARALLAAQEDPATPDQADGLLEEATTLLATPALGWLFDSGTLAEVGISADLAELGGRRIIGAIDRLVIAQDHILAVDYKSNILVPDRAEQVPAGLLRQMGAYAAALAQIWPGRRVEVAILWTRTAKLMPLPHDLVMAALRSTTLT